MEHRTSPEDVASAADGYRPELLVYCYQMLGSVHEAQDIVQETMMRAWRAAATYDPDRASIRTWLHRIATNACLTALRSRQGRPLPAGVGQPFDDPNEPFVPGLEVAWLQPFPDRMLDAVSDPADITVQRSQLRLAVVAALQLLPARQRAAVILRDVLSLSAAEASDVLGTSEASLNSALQRGRARLREADLSDSAAEATTAEERDVIDRYVEAFERADVAALKRLVADDVILEMPPMRNWYRGGDHYAGFMHRVFDSRGTSWRTMRTSANGQPGFAAYVDQDGHHALHTLQVLTVGGGAVRRTTVFQDAEVFELFQLDPVLSDESAPSGE